jgi:hypothetical protein
VSYAFTAAGEARANLAERVIFNSFHPTRYAEFVKRALNDAVTAICREVGYLEAYEVLSYSSTGAVTAPAKPWHRVSEVWSATATAAAQGELAFANAATYQLQQLGGYSVADIGGPGSPLGYVARRATSPSGFRPQVDIVVVPPGTGGYVAVKGLQAPAVMDSDDDVTGLGAEFDGAVVAYAKAACFDNEDDFEAAAVWRQRYEAELRQAVEGGVANDDGSPDTVPGMWDC